MSTTQGKYRGKKIYMHIYHELITAARYRGTVTYQEIAKIMGLPLQGQHMGSQLGHILGEISEDEVNKGRPMLSAVAVGVSGYPGEGFYALAKELGKLKDESKEARLQFWEEEKAESYKTWKVDLGDK